MSSTPTSANAHSHFAPHPRALGVRAIIVAALGLFAAFMSLGLGTSARADSSIFNNWNTGGVMNNPSHATVFVLTRTTHINTIDTYHWNGGLGATPGMITLFDQNTSNFYGPYQAHGSSGQGARANVNWTVTPNVNLPAGSYQIQDSDNATWSNNVQTFYRGFANVRGDLTNARPSAPSRPGIPSRPFVPSRPSLPSRPSQPYLPPIILPSLAPAALTAACSPGFVPLPPFQPAAQPKFAAWVNPCTFGFVQNTCRFYGLSAVVVRAGYYYVGRTAYTEILAGCV